MPRINVRDILTRTLAIVGLQRIGKVPGVLDDIRLTYQLDDLSRDNFAWGGTGFFQPARPGFLGTTEIGCRNAKGLIITEAYNRQIPGFNGGLFVWNQTEQLVMDSPSDTPPALTAGPGIRGRTPEARGSPVASVRVGGTTVLQVPGAGSPPSTDSFSLRLNVNERVLEGFLLQEGEFLYFAHANFNQLSDVSIIWKELL